MRIPACVMANLRAQFTSAEANVVIARTLTHLRRSGCAPPQGYAPERRDLGVGLLANSSLATLASNQPQAASLPRERRRLCVADAVQGSHGLSLRLSDTPWEVQTETAIPGPFYCGDDTMW